MDRFADGMIARGPTLGPDRERWTGSLHILDLPSPEAARRFVEDEPYNRAGLFARHLVRRFDDRLGRTMWEFPGGADEPRYLVIAQGPGAVPPPDLAAIGRERLIVHGELRTPDAQARPAGIALALQAPTRAAVDAILGNALDARFDVEVLDWEFGGRR